MKSLNPHIDYRIQVKKNKTEGILSYDYDNCYPQRVREEVRASGTASNCVNTYAKFMRGSGFTNEDFYKAHINRFGLTPDKLLRKHTEDFALWHGYATLFKYDVLLRVTEVYHMAFEYCRLVDPENEKHGGQIAIYDDWDKKKRPRIDASKITFIDLYTENVTEIDAQIARAGGFQLWDGQVKWYSKDGEDYPMPIYDPVIEDVRTDAGIKKYRFRTVSTNFMPSHILVLPYELEGVDNGPSGARGEENEDRQAFINSLKSFQGTENANKIFVIENRSQAGTPIDLQKVDIQDGDKMFEVTNKTTKDSIIESFSIPPILVGVQVAGKLGSSTDIKDAYDYYNLVTVDERIMFEEEYKKIFNRFDVMVNPLGDYSIVALRFSTGEEPALIDTLGVGGTQAMMDVLANATMTSTVKVNTLIVVFGLSKEKADALVLGTPL